MDIQFWMLWMWRMPLFYGFEYGYTVMDVVDVTDVMDAIILWI